MDAEVEEYNYDGRLVFRGNLDPTHSTESVQVYWLYDSNSKRVGVAEHTGDEHTALWFKDNVFSTLLQEDWETHDKTVWSLMSQAAYEDCVRYGWTTIDKLAEHTSLTLVTPSAIVNGIRSTQRCVKCLGPRQERCTVKHTNGKIDPYKTLFVDDDGVLYVPPSDSKVFEKDVPNTSESLPNVGAGQ